MVKIRLKRLGYNKQSAENWVKKGAQTTETVAYLIKNCDENGNLVYNKKTEQKLSKKALAKLEAQKQEEAAQAAAAAEAAAAESDAENEAKEEQA